MAKMVKNTVPIRSSKEFRDLINYIRAAHIMGGKKCPTTSQITRLVAKRINKQRFLEDEFFIF